MDVIDCEPPTGDTVMILEDVLRMAQEGRISAVAIAVVYRDGSTGDAWSKPLSTAALIGAVTVLQTRLTHRITDKD